MVLSRSTGGLLLLAVLLAGCATAGERSAEIAPDPSVSSSSAWSSTEPDTVAPSTSPPEPEQLQLVCNGIALPDNDPSLSGLEVAGSDGDAAWDAAAAKYGVDMRGDDQWRILSKTTDELHLIARATTDSQLGDTFTLATFTRNGDTWAPGTLAWCPGKWGREGLLNVDSVEVDMSRRTPEDATSLELVVLDDSYPCGTGDPDSIVPVVDETADTVSIVVLTEPSLDVSSGCPAEFVSITVALKSPLGDREVFDGSSRPGRPLMVLKPDQHLNVIMLGGSVAGWWDADNSAWVESNPVSPGIPLAPGTELQVASLDGPQPSVFAGTPMRDCEPLGTWTTSLEPVVDGGADTVAVDGIWPLLPRPVAVLSPTIPDYQRAVVEYLQQRGLTDVPVVVDQVIRTDLDGDGVDEVIVAAHHPDATTGLPAQAGYFSVVLLRRVVNGGVDTSALFEDLHAVADTDYPTMGIGNVSVIADLNGDGAMEIAINSSYFESGVTNVYDTTSNVPKKVLSAGCGS